MTHWWHLRPGEGRFFAQIVAIGGPIALFIGALAGIFATDPGPALPGRAVAPTSTSSTTVAPPGTREGSPTLAPVPGARAIQATRERATTPAEHPSVRPVVIPAMETRSAPAPSRTAAVTRPTRSTTLTPVTTSSATRSPAPPSPPTTSEDATPPSETVRTATPWTPEHTPKSVD